MSDCKKYDKENSKRWYNIFVDILSIRVLNNHDSTPRVHIKLEPFTGYLKDTLFFN